MTKYYLPRQYDVLEVTLKDFKNGIYSVEIPETKELVHTSKIYNKETALKIVSDELVQELLELEAQKEVIQIQINDIKDYIKELAKWPN